MTLHAKAPSGSGQVALCGAPFGNLDHIAQRASNVDCPTCMAKLSDPVNRPDHYTRGGIETIDFIEAKIGEEGFIGYLEGNVFKYMSRWRHKGARQDLEKAQWYLTRLIKFLEEDA